MNLPPTKLEEKFRNAFYCYSYEDLVSFISEEVKEAERVGYEEALEKVMKGTDELTVFYRSKFSRDCGSGETEKEKSTEMIALANLQALLTKLRK